MYVPGPSLSNERYSPDADGCRSTPVTLVKDCSSQRRLEHSHVSCELDLRLVQ